MLSIKRRSRLVAAASLFAALYAVLGLIPVSPYVVGPGFLPANKVIAPLAGMLFGPLTGGVSVLIGNAIDFAYKGQVRLDTGFADLAIVLVAGLAYSGRRTAAVALPVVLLAWFYVEPISVTVIDVAGVPVPFAWMHMLSVGTLIVVLALEGTGRLNRRSVVFMAGVVFASMLTGQIVGTMVGETQVRLGVGLTQSGWSALMQLVFYRYPVERAFYTIAALLVAVPVIRALAKRGETTTASG